MLSIKTFVCFVLLNVLLCSGYGVEEASLKEAEMEGEAKMRGKMEGEMEGEAKMRGKMEGEMKMRGKTKRGDMNGEMEGEASKETVGEEGASKNASSSEEAVKELSEDLSLSETPKKAVKNFTCQVTGALIDMSNAIKELDKDIKAIKTQMFEKCPGFDPNQNTNTSSEIAESDDAVSAIETKEEKTSDDEEEEEEAKSKIPQIPTSCDPPFQLVASSCFYFLYYPQDWKTWGDANAYCQNIGGTLAAPYRIQELRTYLQENFSNVFWVGARKNEGTHTFQWLNGNELEDEDWKEGQPSKSAAKFCVYLEFFSDYKAINHYCGEKFSFVCEKRMEKDE